MSKDFFEEKEEMEEANEEQEEVARIKLGEQEFTEEELAELVGKAKELNEFEEKQGQPWKEVAKSWGKRGERIGSLKKELEEKERALAERASSSAALPEQQREELVRQELKKFGVVTKPELESYYEERRNKEKTMAKVNKVIRNARRNGYPSVEAEDLVEFISNPDNPRDPEVAYKIMFEEEIDKIKQKKLESIKSAPMVTTRDTDAGGKNFKPKKVTKETLRSTLSEHFKQGS